MDNLIDTRAETTNGVTERDPIALRGAAAEQLHDLATRGNTNLRLAIDSGFPSFADIVERFREVWRELPTMDKVA